MSRWNQIGLHHWVTDWQWLLANTFLSSLILYLTICCSISHKTAWRENLSFCLHLLFTVNYSWKYSHGFACATVHVIAFWQECKNTSFCKWSLRGAFTKDDISTWLSWNFFCTHKTDKLTVLSSELCQPQDRYKINASRVFFFWHWTFFRHATYKDKEESLCNALPLYSVHALALLKSQRLSHLQIYSKRHCCCCTRQMNWRFLLE